MKFEELFKKYNLTSIDNSTFEDIPNKDKKWDVIIEVETDFNYEKEYRFVRISGERKIRIIIKEEIPLIEAINSRLSGRKLPKPRKRKTIEYQDFVINYEFINNL